MAEAQPIMSPERKEQAKVYRQIQYRLRVIKLALNLLFMAAFLPLGKWVWDASGQAWVYALVFLVVDAVVSVPLEFYGYRLSVRYGISIQSVGGWLGDQLKGFLVSLVIMLPTMLGLFWLWSAHPATWYLWMAAGAAVFVILMIFISPVLIAPLFQKYKPLGDGELKDRLLELSKRAGVYVKGVFTMDASKKGTALNASLSGIGATRRIVLFDTLTEALTVDEVEVVMAHEMGHHVHAHIPKIVGMMIAFLGGLFLVAGLILTPLSTALGLGGLAAPALPLVMMLYVVLGVPLMPLYTAISRHFEREADTFALDMTRNPGAFITAFRTLADKNLADLDPAPWVYYFFYTHPPIPERVAMAERWRAGH